MLNWEGGRLKGVRAFTKACFDTLANKIQLSRAAIKLDRAEQDYEISTLWESANGVFTLFRFKYWYLNSRWRFKGQSREWNMMTNWERCFHLESSTQMGGHQDTQDCFTETSPPDMEARGAVFCGCRTLANITADATHTTINGGRSIASTLSSNSVVKQVPVMMFFICIAYSIDIYISSVKVNFICQTCYTCRAYSIIWNYSPFRPTVQQTINKQNYYNSNKQL